jgi:small subunit ribosomal protein S1
MSYLPEDLELDEGYWKSLLAEAEGESASARRVASPQAQSEQSPAHNGDASSSDRSTSDHPDPERSHAERWQGIGRENRASFSAHIGTSHTEPSREQLQQWWETLREALNLHDWLDVEVTGVNRGGLIVHFHALRGFVPSSHLASVSPDMDEPTRRGVLANHLGHRLHLRVIELEPEQDRVVFSERADIVQDEDAPVEIPAVLREIQSGETRSGKVTNLTAFGAFVDLGGYEGLIHVSELSWSRVGHPRDLLAIGQEIKVYVISANPSQGRIALSLKRARSDPWHDIERRYRIGQTVQGIITNVVQFGAFAKVEEDLEGLIHVSELAEGSFLHPRNIVKEGDAVVARVIGVDGHARRLALSLRGMN